MTKSTYRFNLKNDRVQKFTSSMFFPSPYSNLITIPLKIQVGILFLCTFDEGEHS